MPTDGAVIRGIYPIGGFPLALTFLDVVSAVDLDEGLALRVVQVGLDNSYPTGGEAIAESDLQLASGSIRLVLVSQAAPTDTNALKFDWDYTNKKIMAFRVDQIDDFLEQVPAATDLSTVVLRVFAIGLPE